MRKVTIIGAGNVGATIAYTLAVNGIANEVVMIDIKTEKAQGEAMDIAQGSPFFPGAQVVAGDYPDAAGSDIVVITSGVARKPGQSRLDLAQINVDILCNIAPKITRYAPNAIYLIVSNPVDVMTYVFNKVSGIPQDHIIGSGTILDTARLRSSIADHLDISQQNVHAHVFGEHGDSSFVPWSQAAISSVDIEDYRENYLFTHRDRTLPAFDKAAIEEYVHTSGAQIISRKGATFYAVAVSTCHICKCIFSGRDTAMTVSSMMHGEYGLEDVCLSILTVVGEEGIKATVPAKLTEEEVAKLHRSADRLRDVIGAITF